MTDIDTLIAEDRIIRRAWTRTDEQGREMVCLLAALSPEVAEAHDASACPAEIMPQWLAHLTPWMDDRGSTGAWPAMIRRYAALSNRWHVLDDAAWRRAEYKSRAAIVREAMRHTTSADVLALCERVVALCDRVVSGDEPGHAAWTEAAEAAEAATLAWVASTAEVAFSASAAAAWAAWAAARAAAEAAWVAAAEAAAEAAAWVASTAKVAAWAAADRITTSILDAIEAEIVRDEG